MDICDFINNWVRPEVKALIQQYTLCCPFKEEIKNRMKRHKRIKYGWMITKEYCFDTCRTRHFSLLYIEDTTKTSPFEKWTDILKEGPSGNVTPCIWLSRAHISW